MLHSIRKFINYSIYYIFLKTVKNHNPRCWYIGRRRCCGGLRTRPRQQSDSQRTLDEYKGRYLWDLERMSDKGGDVNYTP